ncbi:MAG: FAD-dependent monooxygenase [Aestuariivirga sp.]
MESFDCIVAGGGPAGLAAAILSAKHGLRTALIAPPQQPDPRTVALMQPSIQLLTNLGVWPEPLKIGSAPLARLTIIDETGLIISAPTVTFEAEELGHDAFGWNIALQHLTRTLFDAAKSAGVFCFEGLIKRAETAGDSVILHSSDELAFTAPAIIAADGRTSLLRDAAGISVDKTDYKQSALATSFSHSAPHNNTSVERHGPEGAFTTVPLPGSRSSLVWMARPDEAQRLHDLSEAELAVEIQLRSHGELGLIREIGPRKLFPMIRQVARKFAARRIFLVGEAAHVMPPLGAQGLNLSLRDAAYAVESIAASRGDPGSAVAQKDYDGLRRSDVMFRIAAIDAMNRSLLADILPFAGARAAAMAAISAVPAFRQFAMKRGLGESGTVPAFMTN